MHALIPTSRWTRSRTAQPARANRRFPRYGSRGRSALREPRWHSPSAASPRQRAHRPPVPVPARETVVPKDPTDQLYEPSATVTRRHCFATFSPVTIRNSSSKGSDNRFASAAS
jgi:hypothetical protein